MRWKYMSEEQKAEYYDAFMEKEIDRLVEGGEFDATKPENFLKAISEADVSIVENELKGEHWNFFAIGETLCYWVESYFEDAVQRAAEKAFEEHLNTLSEEGLL